MDKADDEYDDIISTKLQLVQFSLPGMDRFLDTLSNESTHDSGPNDFLSLPPKPDFPLPPLPPKSTEPTTQAHVTLQGTSKLTENLEEEPNRSVVDGIPPVPPKPSEIDCSAQEFDVSLFTEFNESLSLHDLPAADNLNTGELPDFSFLSPPSDSLFELPGLPESLDLSALSISSDAVDRPVCPLPAGMYMYMYLSKLRECFHLNRVNLSLYLIE